MATVDYAGALSRPRPSPRTKKPELDHLRIREAENGGHIVEHHFANSNGPYVEEDQYAFGEHDGEPPKLPEGHVLHHIAKHMNIEHELIGKQPKGAIEQETEQEEKEESGAE